jgi:hypothetical protein
MLREESIGVEGRCVELAMVHMLRRAMRQANGRSASSCIAG